MANRLTMAEIDRILTLHTTEHSNREIADILLFNIDLHRTPFWFSVALTTGTPRHTEPRFAENLKAFGQEF